MILAVVALVPFVSRFLVVTVDLFRILRRKARQQGKPNVYA